MTDDMVAEFRSISRGADNFDVRRDRCILAKRGVQVHRIGSSDEDELNASPSAE